MELEKARSIAEELKNQLQESCHRLEIVGGIRRQKPEVDKISILCIPTLVKGEPIPTEYRDLFRHQRPLPEFDDDDAVD